MLFTWSTDNLCIVFKWWHIRSTITLLLSLLAIIVLTAGYELVRGLSRRYEASVSDKLANMPRKFALRLRNHPYAYIHKLGIPPCRCMRVTQSIYSVHRYLICGSWAYTLSSERGSIR